MRISDITEMYIKIVILQGNIFKSFTSCWLQGVENVYTQHQPLLFQTMEGIVKGRLRDADYPFVGNHFQQGRLVKVTLFFVDTNRISETNIGR